MKRRGEWSDSEGDDGEVYVCTAGELVLITSPHNLDGTLAIIRGIRGTGVVCTPLQSSRQFLNKADVVVKPGDFCDSRERENDAVIAAFQAFVESEEMDDVVMHQSEEAEASVPPTDSSEVKNSCGELSENMIGELVVNPVKITDLPVVVSSHYGWTDEELANSIAMGSKLTNSISTSPHDRLLQAASLAVENNEPLVALRHLMTSMTLSGVMLLDRLMSIGQAIDIAESMHDDVILATLLTTFLMHSKENLRQAVRLNDLLLRQKQFAAARQQWAFWAQHYPTTPTVIVQTAKLLTNDGNDAEKVIGILQRLGSDCELVSSCESCQLAVQSYSMAAEIILQYFQANPNEELANLLLQITLRGLSVAMINGLPLMKLESWHVNRPQPKKRLVASIFGETEMTATYLKWPKKWQTERRYIVLLLRSLAESLVALHMNRRKFKVQGEKTTSPYLLSAMTAAELCSACSESEDETGGQYFEEMMLRCTAL